MNESTTKIRCLENLGYGKCSKILDTIAPDKDWRQLGIYPPLFGLIGYFKI